MMAFLWVLAGFAFLPIPSQACVMHMAHPLSVQRGLNSGRPLSAVEELFLSVPSNDSARETLYHYTSESHVAGSPGDLAMAEYTASMISSFGIDAVVEPVSSLLSFPLSRAVEILESGKVVYSAKLSEDVIFEDPTSDEVLRNKTYLGYAPSGEGVGRLVYANYARPEDFDTLEAAGISVEGAVVIARYGECFRGLKARNAQQRGAVAVIIYSDPIDDGFTLGDVFPDGPWRPSSSVQRGSTWFISSCAGDPARSYLDEDIKEVCGYDTEDLVPKIPAIPMSYEDAEPLLRSLGGEQVPDEWAGGLNFVYRFGPSRSSVVRVAVRNEQMTTPIWNTIARIPGTLADDRPVILGNHRDAWVFGAVDPNSGSTAMIEVARGLGALLESGWRPKRTIYLCSWSGEEFGLIGSTAWGELNARSGLLENASVYINVDVGVAGDDFQVSATPALASVVADVIASVPDPTNPQSVVAERWDGHVGTLGSGSDYTVFLDHLGVASIDMSFKGNYGVYHSIYDSFTWVETQADPTFEIHVAMARIWGLVALRFADADVMPFDHGVQASAVTSYVETVRKMVDTHHNHTHANEEQMRTIDFSGLEDAALQYANAAANIMGELEVKDTQSLNDRLAFTERRFLAPEGLSKRPWFKHVLQCPGLDTGYGADVLPGVVQAIRDNDPLTAQVEVDKAAAAILAAALYLSSDA